MGNFKRTKGRVAALVLGAFAAGALPGGPGGCSAIASPSGSYAYPVQGRITRHFEEPAGPYGPGHRGVDFDDPPGTPVKASNGGKVIFAGPVADDGLFVTIQHSDGLKTTYSFLAELKVAAGDQVERNQEIALSGAGHPGGPPSLHFGVKRGDRYIDPELVLGNDYNDISNALALTPTDQQPAGNGNFAAGPQADFQTDGGSGGGPAYPGGARGPQPGGPTGGGPRPNGATVGHPPATVANTAQSNGNSGRPYQAQQFTDGSYWNGVDPNGGAWDGLSPNDAPGQHQFRPQPGGRTTTPTRAPGAAGRARPRSSSPAWMAPFKFFNRGAQQFGRAISPSYRKMPGYWDRFRMWAGKKADAAGAFLDPALHKGVDDPLSTFGFGMLSGGFHEISCLLKGGAPPPDLPTTEQLDRHQAKPPPPPNDHILLAIAGIGSSSQEKQGKVTSDSSLYDMDWRTLGYKPGQVYHFSYKGIRNHPGPGPYAIHDAYTEKDTYKAIRDSAAQLSKQIRQIHSREPQKQIDLIAHSQGGIVAEYFVENLYRPAATNSAAVGHLITIESPHQGADLARTHILFSETATGRLVHPLVQQPLSKFIGAPASNAPSVGELQESSQFVRNLKRAYDPKKVDTTTIGGTFDPVVTAQHTRLPSTRHYTTKMDPAFNPLNYHGETTHSRATKGFVYNALAGHPSRCTAMRDAFAEYGPGNWIAIAEDGALEGSNLLFKAQDSTSGVGDQPIRNVRLQR